jgi:hypothetical protein
LLWDDGIMALGRWYCVFGTMVLWLWDDGIMALGRWYNGFGTMVFG